MTRKNILFAVFAAALALAAALGPRPEFVPQAQASVTNVAISNPGVMLVPLTFSGQYTTTASGVAGFNMPMPCDMLGVGARARASTGTGVITIDVKSGGVSILSAPFSITTASWSEGTISTTAIPDENAIAVDLGLVTAFSTVNDVTVLLTCVRK